MTQTFKPQTVAQLLAEYLVSQRVTRVYGLIGGHIQPLWDAVVRAGIQILDVRHEGAAVYMAHAESELSGQLGVAMITAGPGVTNAVTAISNASIARVPVLVIAGRPPRPQAGLGAMQELPQAEILRPVTRRVDSVIWNRHLLERLDATVLAALGSDGPSGPALIEFPTDLLYEYTYQTYPPIQWKYRTVHTLIPTPEDIEAARSLIVNARRPVIIGGRSAHSAADAIASYLDMSGALYLDTGESRGAVHHTHPSYVPAMRARSMQEADLIITLGRRLDYQLAYGSSVAFSPSASFLRIGRSVDEISENRRGDVEMRSDTLAAVKALTTARAVPTNPDGDWLKSIRVDNERRQNELAKAMIHQPTCSDGRLHPNWLIHAINARLDDQSIVVMDGGDILSFARAGLKAVRSLDCGALGCLGVGVPFATAAAISKPEQTVFALIGDGALGFSAMELSTAARYKVKVLFLIANNAAWGIDLHDQLERYDGHLAGVELPDHRYDILAESLGLYGELVERAEDLDDAMTRALQRLPALLNVRISKEPSSPDFKKGLAAVRPYHALRRWDELEREKYP
jgi:acetolactate synthase-1/2/3 large subunit